MQLFNLVEIKSNHPGLEEKENEGVNIIQLQGKQYYFLVPAFLFRIWQKPINIAVVLQMTLTMWRTCRAIDLANKGAIFKA